jgi:hypothetical protein
MTENPEKNGLISSARVNSLSKNLNSAADAITTFSIFGIAIYLYNFALIKIQESEIGSFEKFEINWDVIVTSLFLLLATIGLNYILRGISVIIRILQDIKSK